jgi:NAD(P)-dependent dehydrogenase (short-subunit alcohol dehydrogenase family)
MTLTALITGGAGGLARAMIDALSEDGVTCVAADRDPLALERLKSEKPGVLTTVADVANSETCAASIAYAMKETGRLDLLINNAGIGMSSLRGDAETTLPSLEELSDEIWDQFFTVNVRGALAMTRAAFPHLKRSPRGQVVNVTTSYFTMHRVAPYGPTKAAMESMTAIFAKQFAEDGVAFNVLVPGGATDTPFVSDASGFDRSKLLKPSVMGPPIRWLASRAPKEFTGMRIAGQDWDQSLSEDEAAKKAARPAAWPELAPTPAWAK